MGTLIDVAFWATGVWLAVDILVKLRRGTVKAARTITIDAAVTGFWVGVAVTLAIPNAVPFEIETAIGVAVGIVVGVVLNRFLKTRLRVVPPA